MHTTQAHDAMVQGRRDDVFRIALVAGSVFLPWKAARGARQLAFAAIGLGMAAYWTGMWAW